MGEIKEEVLRALKELSKERRLLTASEIADYLRTNGIHKSTKWISVILKYLVHEGKILEVPRGRITYYMLHPSQLDNKQHILDEYIRVDKEVETLSELKAKLEAEEYLRYIKELPARTPSEVIAKEILHDKLFPEILEKRLEEIAPELSKENPKKLLREMFEDLIHRYRKYAEELKGTKDRKREEELYKKLERIIHIINTVYVFVLGIPISHSKKKPRGPSEVARIYLPDRRMKEYEAEYDLNLLIRYLERRIPDESFIVFENGEGGYDLLLGIDTSTMPVSIIIPHILRRAINLRLNTVVGYTTSTDENGKRRPIIFPRPESIDGYEEDRAEEEGIIIRPETLSFYPDYYHDRIREAQMEYLQNKFINKSLSPDPSDADIYEKLKRPPNALLSDGRIFPAEHKLGDYVALHGKFVRKSIRAYVSLLRNAEALKDHMVILGVVKRGQLAYLWKIVSWYMMKKGLISEEEFLDPRNLYTGGEKLRDEYISYLIFKKVWDPIGKKFPRTFSIIRRFYSMDRILMNALGQADTIDAENDIMFWFKEATIYGEGTTGLSGYVEDHGLEGDEAWPYSEACARGAVAMFYYIPPINLNIPNSHQLRPPRFEVVIPYSYLKEPSMQDKIRGLISNAIKGINSDEPVTYEEAVEGIFLIVPSVVKMAHQHVKNFQSEIALHYSKYLLSQALKKLKEYESLFLG